MLSPPSKRESQQEVLGRVPLRSQSFTSSSLTSASPNLRTRQVGVPVAWANPQAMSPLYVLRAEQTKSLEQTGLPEFAFKSHAMLQKSGPPPNGGTSSSTPVWTSSGSGPTLERHSCVFEQESSVRPVLLAKAAVVSKGVQLPNSAATQSRVMRFTSAPALQQGHLRTPVQVRAEMSPVGAPNMARSSAQYNQAGSPSSVNNQKAFSFDMPTSANTLCACIVDSVSRSSSAGHSARQVVPPRSQSAEPGSRKPQSSPESWQVVMVQMREELLSNMSAQYMPLQEIVRSLRGEILANKAKVDALHSDVDAKIRKEFQEGRIQVALDDLQEQVLQMRRCIENSQHEGRESKTGIRGSFGMEKTTSAAIPALRTLHQRVEDLGSSLEEEEHEARCQRDKYWNARLSQKVSELSRCLEEQRIAFAEEMAAAIRASFSFEDISPGAAAQAPHELHAILKVVQHLASDTAASADQTRSGSTSPIKSVRVQPEEGGDIHKLYEMGWEDFRDVDDTSDAVVAAKQRTTAIPRGHV